MKSELFWLALTLVITILHTLPYIFERIGKEGINAVKDPQPNLEASAGWAIRARRAHSNAIENLVIFSSLILILSNFQN